MDSLREKPFLEESRDSWQVSADHDKRQALTSFVIAGCGVAIGTAGSIGTIEGEPVIGVPGIVVGVGMLMAGYRAAKQDIESAMEMQGKVAVREHEIISLEGLGTRDTE